MVHCRAAVRGGCRGYSCGMDDDDYDTNPVGLFGRLRNMKALTWIVIIGLLALTIGGSAIIFFVQSLG